MDKIDRAIDLLCETSVASSCSAFAPRACAALPSRFANEAMVYTAKKNRQLMTTRLHRGRTRRDGQWDSVRAPVETLVEDPVPPTIVPQNLDVCASAIVKNEDRFPAGVATEVFPHDTGEPVEGQV
jgi:hypothetical protein